MSDRQVSGSGDSRSATLLGAEARPSLSLFFKRGPLARSPQPLTATAAGEGMKDPLRWLSSYRARAYGASVSNLICLPAKDGL